MHFKTFCARKVLIIGILLPLIGCGGESQPVTGQSDDCISAKSPGAIAADVCDVQSSVPGALTLDTEVTGSVNANDSDVYTIASGTQVSLKSDSGDADLYLSSSATLDFFNDTILCGSEQPFIEDNCSASIPDGNLFAHVVGSEPSNYRISITDDCSIESINQWIYRNMQDYYLFADRIPALDPTSYTDSSELMNDLRFDELDPYSSISDALSFDTFFNEGQSYGFGLDWQWDANDNARVIFVFENSEADRAGIKRGDILVAIEGERWADLNRDRYFELVGTRDNPRTTTWTIIEGSSETSTEVEMTYGEYSINTVLYLNTYTHPEFSGKIGYVVFNGFLDPSVEELNNAIEWLIDNNTTELILDLRYNSGGFVRVAQRLASQLAGPSLAGNTLARNEHNEKYQSNNQQIQFINATPSLDLDKLVVLTTRDTASASELVINSLRPYIDVITIGTRTDGKSYVSESKRFCGKSLNAMQSQTVNASGVSVEGGIEADCYAADDVSRPFGIDPLTGDTEGMLQSALDYYINGSCDVGPVLAKQPVNASDRITFSARTALTRAPEYGVPGK